MSGTLWNDEPVKPIEHLRVVDLSVMLTGPYLTRILAQYGAQVIKVEKNPDGDPTRASDSSSLFKFLNQGKKSVCLDLLSPEGRDLIKTLVSESDVFVENFREGVMDKLGLGYAELAERNPDLIYVSLRGFSGKFGSKPGHDLNFIATSGVGEWFLENGPNYSAQFGDVVGGVFSPLIKLLMHLANPNRRGMHLISYADEGFRSLYVPRAFEVAHREASKEKNNLGAGMTSKLSGQYPNSRYYRCRDNQFISLQAIQKKHWDQFCEAVDKAEWKDRAEDLSLVPEMEKLFQDAPAAYWEALSSTGENCMFRVIPWEEFFQLSTSRHQLERDPLAWAGFAPCQTLEESPALGRDSFSIAHNLGYSNEEISRFMASGILFQTK